MSDITLVLCFACMLFVPCLVASITLLHQEGKSEAGLLPPIDAAASPSNADAALTRQELAAKRSREIYRRGLL
jgi:hypothetical protein